MRRPPRAPGPRVALIVGGLALVAAVALALARGSPAPLFIALAFVWALNA